MKMWRKKNNPAAERRRYVRLDSVFPVSFRLQDLDGKEFLSDWLQGFTHNVSEGGICLEVNNLKPELVNLIKNQQVKLSLGIEMPLTCKAVPALARIAWVKEVADIPVRYLIGLSYEEIAPAGNRRIMHYAWMKKLFIPTAVTIILVLGIAFGMNIFVNLKLIQGNRALVRQLFEILQESSVAKQKIKELATEREDLQLKMQALQLRIQTVEQEKAGLEVARGVKEEKVARNIKQLNDLIDKLTKEKFALQEELIVIQHKENTVTEELLRLDKKKITLTQANIDKMYQWLKVHQNPRTGLVMSFEGDSEIADWAFIYDQALLVLTYTYFGDFPRAQRILDFFYQQAKRMERKFLNAYYVRDGKPAEYAVHSGPNIWLGIAIMHYTKKTEDKTYLNLAREIASGVISLQKEDKEGGIRGGPHVEWYSSEHNLDAYAFFNMLYRFTGKSEYLHARDKVLQWLVKHIYDRVDIPVKRGKGDSTIATDTYAWSIAALGPQKLEELGMNPDRIIEFAEKNCVVRVSYVRPEGQKIEIKGFDFAPQRHLPRGGVVSSEWTAQMVLAFKIMANFYRQKEMPAKAHAYEMKANEYLAELGKMIISSPSPSGQGESCLPYATQDFVDTGHGWMTPKGKNTGSVAGTIYTLFAYYNYNPLVFKE